MDGPRAPWPRWMVVVTGWESSRLRGRLLHRDDVADCGSSRSELDILRAFGAQEQTAASEAARVGARVFGRPLHSHIHEALAYVAERLGTGGEEAVRHRRIPEPKYGHKDPTERG